jgi:hypothetical protein
MGFELLDCNPVFRPLDEREQLAVAYPVEILEILRLEPRRERSTISGRASNERGRLTRCLPSEFFEVLRQVLALAGSTFRKSFKRESHTHGLISN